MTPDPTRVESTRIPGGVRVSALWVQRALNATGDYDLVEDDVAGQHTFDALYDFADKTEADAEPRAGRLGDDQHVLLSTLLEAALVEGGPVGPSSLPARVAGTVGRGAVLLGGGLVVLVGLGLWWLSRR